MASQPWVSVLRRSYNGSDTSYLINAGAASPAIRRKGVFLLTVAISEVQCQEP